MNEKARKWINSHGWMNVTEKMFGIRVLGLWLYMSRIRLRHGRKDRQHTPEELRSLNARHERAVLSLWERQKGGCRICGVKLMPSQMQIHHIRPRSIHPELEWEPGNLQGVCSRCHQLLHSIPAEPETVRREILWMARREERKTE